MREQGSGVIINLITHPDSEVNEAAFVASMNGLEGLTRAAARELNPYGIHVYTVENRGDKIVASVFALLQTKNL